MVTNKQMDATMFVSITLRGYAVWFHIVPTRVMQRHQILYAGYNDGIVPENILLKIFKLDRAAQGQNTQYLGFIFMLRDKIRNDNALDIPLRDNNRLIKALCLRIITMRLWQLLFATRRYHVKWTKKPLHKTSHLINKNKLRLV